LFWLSQRMWFVAVPFGSRHDGPLAAGYSPYD